MKLFSLRNIRLMLQTLLMGTAPVAQAQEMVSITPLDTPHEFSCRAVSAVSDKVIWASGTGNTVLKTTDGGRTWQGFTPADSLKLDFRCLYAWDENNALVFSIDRPALGLRTSDGGSTWRQVYYNDAKGIFLNSVSFSDDKHGIAVGDPIGGRYVVIRTEDGGETWHDAKAPEGNGGMFAASNGCVQLLPSGKAMLTTGGTGSYVFIQDTPDAEWQRYDTPLAAGDENHCDGGYGVTMLDDRRGFVVGGNYAKVDRRGNVAYTEDGGRTWTLRETGLHGFTSSIQQMPQMADVMVAVGSDGVSWSSNAGLTWKNLKDQLPEGCKGFHAVSAARSGFGVFAAGANGKMVEINIWPTR